MECLLRHSMLHLLDSSFSFFYHGMEESNTLKDPGLAEESTSGKEMTRTKHSKVVREEFGSNLGLYFLVPEMNF